MNDPKMPVNSTQEKQARAPYQKPQIIQVSLRPKETILGFCKSTSFGGPDGALGSCTFGITKCME